MRNKVRDLVLPGLRSAYFLSHRFSFELGQLRPVQLGLGAVALGLGDVGLSLGSSRLWVLCIARTGLMIGNLGVVGSPIEDLLGDRDAHSHRRGIEYRPPNL